MSAYLAFDWAEELCQKSIYCKGTDYLPAAQAVSAYDGAHADCQEGKPPPAHLLHQFNHPASNTTARGARRLRDEVVFPCMDDDGLANDVQVGTGA